MRKRKGEKQIETVALSIEFKPKIVEWHKNLKERKWTDEV
jgi:hypothetical protein